MRPHIAEPSYFDGGLIYNFPIKAFDRKGYVTPSTPDDEKDYYQFNRKTLGFNIYSAEEERTRVDKVKAIETVGDLLTGIYNVYREAEFHISNMDDDPRNKKRIIDVDNQGIALSEFNVTPLLGKGAKAIDEAEQKTKKFYDKQENDVKGIVTVPVNPSKPKIERPIKQELHISEEEAKKLLTLGPRALEYIRACKITKAFATTEATILSLFIITIPIAAVSMKHCYQEPKSLESRRLELLAIDDPRFLFFRYMGNGEFDEAWEELDKNRHFFIALMKTFTFVSKLKKSLIKCDNTFYRYDADYDDLRDLETTSISSGNTLILSLPSFPRNLCTTYPHFKNNILLCKVKIKMPILCL